MVLCPACGTVPHGKHATSCAPECACGLLWHRDSRLSFGPDSSCQLTSGYDGSGTGWWFARNYRREEDADADIGDLIGLVVAYWVLDS